ncbi:class I SAM-dependent methyltransferase [Clostridiales bacterium COT073_COT-073]|nr:class I SAM-dependent methyltransferase [Clostridiales bacterium COT073_COT-073]
MFWDHVSGVYDFFVGCRLKELNRQIGKAAASFLEPDDKVLECACGTGLISLFLARKCRDLTATDFSEGMLKQARKKCRFVNMTIEQADITKLNYEDHSFDKVVAGNVIHLLEQPQAALQELERVCRIDGKIIIPTYVGKSRKSGKNVLLSFLNLFGAGFQQQIYYRDYPAFFRRLGYKNARFYLIKGLMWCAIAVIPVTKENKDNKDNKEFSA